jgi:hypothetical protein
MQPKSIWSAGAGREKTEEGMMSGAASETVAVFKKSLLFMIKYFNQ